MATDEYITRGLFRRVVTVTRGGPGSGFRGHAGRPGEVGGSLPSGEVAEEAKPRLDEVRHRYSPAGFVVNNSTLGGMFAANGLSRYSAGGDRARWSGLAITGNAAKGYLVEWVPRTDMSESDFARETRDRATAAAEVLRRHGIAFEAREQWVGRWPFPGEAAQLFVPPGQHGALVERGGPGSGHFGHAGRPGELGGSEPGDQVAMPSTDIAQAVISEDIAGGRVTISPEDALLGQPIQRIENTVYGTGYTTEDYLQLAQHVVDEQPEAFRQFMVQVEQALEDGTSTMDAYYDAETGEWTPERRLLHDQIVNDILEPGRPAPAGTEPEAVIMGGLPGSGKSSVLAERAASGQFDAYVHIDADIIKGMLPEYEGWNAALLHDESSAIVEQIFQRCVERRLPVMYDATLRSATSGEGIVNALEDIGYNTRLIYVDVPIEESMRRVLSRFASGTGRYVSPFYVATHDGRNLLNWEALKGQVDAWEHWDNGQPQGQRPTLVAQGNRRQS